MSKPIHPATVHFPLAFLMLGFGLDIYHALSPQLPAAITSYFPPAADVTRASYYLIFLGIASFVPAVASGGQQALALFSKQGLFEADGKTVRAKAKATIAHAVTMDLVLVASAYLWNLRRVAAADTLAGKLRVGALSTPEAAYAPEQWAVAVEAALTALLAFSASIGGTLTYVHGVGFSALRTGAKKTQ